MDGDVNGFCLDDKPWDDDVLQHIKSNTNNNYTERFQEQLPMQSFEFKKQQLMILNDCQWMSHAFQTKINVPSITQPFPWPSTVQLPLESADDFRESWIDSQVPKTPLPLEHDNLVNIIYHNQYIYILSYNNNNYSNNIVMSL